MKVKLIDVRLSFPDLFVPVQFKGEGGFNYKASFLMAPKSDNAKKIEAALLEAAIAKWPKNGKAVYESVKGNANKICFIDGSSKEYDGYQGMMCLSSSRAKAKGLPKVLDFDKTPLGEGAGKPYAGCYVDALVEIWAQDNDFGKALRAQLLGVQFRRHGDAFAAGAVASDDDFDNIDAPDEDDLT